MEKRKKRGGNRGSRHDFPLVIAAVIAVIYIVTGLYLSLSLQTSLQLSIRNDACERSKTVYRTGEYKRFKPDQMKFGLSTVLYAEAAKEYKTSKLFTKNIRRTEKGRVYVIDEAELVRRVRFGKEVLN